MIFTGEHWYFGLIQALLLITEIVFGLTVAKSRPVLRKILLVAVAVWFLGRKIGEIMTNHEVPFDFSAVAYFAVSFVVLFPTRQTFFVGAFCGFIAGSLYTLSMIVVPEVHFSRAGDYTVLNAMFNHNMLLFISFLMSAEKKFSLRDVHWIPLYIVAYFMYALLVKDNFNITNVATTFQILDGSIIKVLLPDFELRLWYYILYYIFALTLLSGFTAAVYFISRNRTKPSLWRVELTDPPKIFDFGYRFYDFGILKLKNPKFKASYIY